MSSVESGCCTKNYKKLLEFYVQGPEDDSLLSIACANTIYYTGLLCLNFYLSSANISTKSKRSLFTFILKLYYE